MIGVIRIRSACDDGGSGQIAGADTQPGLLRGSCLMIYALCTAGRPRWANAEHLVS